MLHALRARTSKSDEGFSLIELMIVVLIIAILIAIAIPTFLGARTKSQDRAAQVDLRQSLLTAKSFYTDNQTYVAADAADLEALEPTIDFDLAIANSTEDTVGVTATSTTVVMAKQSRSGTWFCIAESTTAGTTFNSGAALADVDTVAECNQAAW